MRSYHLEPLAEIESAKKRVRHVIFSQVYSRGFRDENPGLPANFTELREHFVFFAHQAGVERYRRLAGNEPRLDERHWNVEALQKWPGFWRVPQHSASVFNDGALDLDNVADEFAGGPAAVAGAGFPLVGRNGVGGGQKLLLSASEIFVDGLKRGHDFHSIARGALASAMRRIKRSGPRLQERTITSDFSLRSK